MPSDGATGYNVKRSTTSGAPYETVFANVAATTYSDATELNPGIRYYYVVSAVNGIGESGHSNETNAVPSAVILPNEYHIAGHTVVDGINLHLTVSDSVPGHEYQIWATESLKAPDWQPVDPVQTGTGSDLEFILPMEETLPQRYFKLDVQRK